MKFKSIVMHEVAKMPTGEEAKVIETAVKWIRANEHDDTVVIEASTSKVSAKAKSKYIKIKDR